ncbi:hypothetical protein N7474_005028 [Penicillium riverlandense]|uniref:uncharacterized protein n=1 Tax=Penicillium riverlandense TaxID=1903569 RepID=UPI002548F540|nr:uncharacterized protein N7474_005028 [Penicillium riverlandense]KAJ5819437.1 hypothetical protein N7474_005028 [Penicillium riverlandense]
MDDTSGNGIYQFSLAHQLFFTDADGQETDPDSAIAAALEGDWKRPEPDAAALLGDKSAGAYDRFLALSALARWTSPTGLRGCLHGGGRSRCATLAGYVDRSAAQPGQHLRAAHRVRREQPERSPGAWHLRRAADSARGADQHRRPDLLRA